MENLAICKTCRVAFGYKPLGSFAPSLVEHRAFCPGCGAEALVAEGDFSGFFRLYHLAIPFAVGRRAKREVLDLAERLVASPTTAAATLQSAALGDDAKRLFDAPANLLLGAMSVAGGLGSAVGVVLMMADSEQDKRQHAEMMDALHNLVAATHEIKGRKARRSAPSASTDSRPKNQSSTPPRTVSPPTDKPRSEKPARRAKVDRDVPLGRTKPK